MNEAMLLERPGPASLQARAKPALRRPEEHFTLPDTPKAVQAASTDGDAQTCACSSSSRSASSAVSGASPFSHRDSLGCGIPVRREISVCDKPAARRSRINSVVALMPALYAMSHTNAMPHRIIRACIVDDVKPHELISALVANAGGSLRVARDVWLAMRDFQRFVNAAWNP